jgi:predicted glutamine amidotransferase
MCQLILTSLNNELLNKRMLYTLMYLDSQTLNKDGSGFYIPKENAIWKSKLSGCAITNLGSILSSHAFGESPVMGHVRSASTIHKILDDAHAHPFFTDKYVVAHNGTLEFKDDTLSDEYDKTKFIDSEIFTLELTKNEKPFLEAIKETMDLFYGKFAFLIFDRVKKTQYVIKGRTASLYKSDVKYVIDKEERPIGYVVNTSSLDLMAGLLFVKNAVELQNPEKLFVYSEATPLDDETVYVANKLTLDKVGKVLETTKPTPVYAGAWADDYVRTGYSYNSAVREDAPIHVKTVVDFMVKNKLSIIDMDNLCYQVFAEPLLGMDKIDLDNLVGILKIIDSRNYGKMISKWTRLREITKKSSLELCNETHLQFPYFLNSLKSVKRVLSEQAKKANVIEEPDNDSDDNEEPAIGVGIRVTKPKKEDIDDDSDLQPFTPVS